jgi:hypothetical protein
MQQQQRRGEPTDANDHDITQRDQPRILFEYILDYLYAMFAKALMLDSGL